MMDITVYLPDEIGREAKAADLNLSRLLRDAVTDDLDRRRALDALDTQVHEVALDDGTIGRITGKLVAYDDRQGQQVYVTDDGRVLLYDETHERVEQVDDPAEDLRGLDGEAYASVADALGFKPIVDL